MSAWGRILPTDTAALFDAAVREAADLLRSGEVIAVPTETVYGLAANALDARAVMRIYSIKNRPERNPVIVHVASLEMARRCAAHWPALADRLAAAFWPGPLTMVLTRSDEIPDEVTAGGPTVGVRWPSHPFIRALILACGFPLAAPSANLSTQISPTNAEHVRKSLGDKIRVIVDGGQAQVGIESTVLDVSVGPPRLLRPGMIHAESVLAVTGELTVGPANEDAFLRSPGFLLKHYSPKARLIVRGWRNEKDFDSQIAGFRLPISEVHVIAHTHIPMNPGLGRVCVIPQDPEAFARAIYAELHRCDETGARLIVAESPPDKPEWHAIADRLNRASAE